jgi:hypothetical protein
MMGDISDLWGFSNSKIKEPWKHSGEEPLRKLTESMFSGLKKATSCDHHLIYSPTGCLCTSCGELWESKEYTIKQGYFKGLRITTNEGLPPDHIAVDVGNRWVIIKVPG